MPPTENSAALFGWHSQDSRATGPLDTADTVTAHYVTGGGNTPLIVQPCICIQGSMIGRAEKNETIMCSTLMAALKDRCRLTRLRHL